MQMNRPYIHVPLQWLKANNLLDQCPTTTVDDDRKVRNAIVNTSHPIALQYAATLDVEPLQYVTINNEWLYGYKHEWLSYATRKFLTNLHSG